MKPGRDPLTLAELQRRFSDETECLRFLERARWPDGPVCPRCGSTDHASRVTTRPGDFTCLDCMRRFSVTAGTPMDHTHLPIRTWIIAAYLLTTSSKGISSLKLASLLGLQYRTTWHLAHRIRAMMADAPDLLRGLVELDETYIGGKGRKRNRPQPPAPRRHSIGTVAMRLKGGLLPCSARAMVRCRSRRCCHDARHSARQSSIAAPPANATASAHGAGAPAALIR